MLPLPASQIRSDPAAVRVLLLLVRRGGRGGTRARFSAARVFAAATLGQLAVQGGIPPSELPSLLSPDNGLAGALMDLAPLALPEAPGSAGSGLGSPQAWASGTGRSPGAPATAPTGGGRARGPGWGGSPGVAASPDRHHGGGGGGGEAGGGGTGGSRQRVKDIDPQEQARSAALTMVGVGGDLRITLGLQAVGALAHLAGEPGGAAALLQLGELMDVLVRLLRCALDDVCGVAAMLAATLSSGGGWPACAAMARASGLVEALVAALRCRGVQVRAYCAVALGNMAAGPPPPPSPDLPPDRAGASLSGSAVERSLAGGGLASLRFMLADCSRLMELWQRRIGAEAVGSIALSPRGSGGAEASAAVVGTASS
ncbi:hypothetical protein GPECTOR_1g905 [Gonium pectorale]|uniref:Uncharacterized protein n=1 Tax=Gonium pectorale TaxID=33097 RepID=A0A150H4M1_GONPE|nr:hypothetical protein GPECTOR_1g905 [Gonium pectorale]|eukprot:KXZ57002.1 hypothetical protein GPECTOR_1g905 [Gonium pectorale]